MINAEQLRAARGLLDWKTSDLAKLSGLTINGINKIERGYVQGRRDTMELLQNILEKAGVEFLPGSGVRKKDRIVETYEGERANHQLLDDIYETLRNTGGEVLISHVDEQLAIESLSEEFLNMHLKRLEEANIKERMLVRQGDTKVVTSLVSYRAIPEKYFLPTAMFIYGDKMGLASWSGAKRSMIINDALFAESARKLFNFIWDHAKPLDEEPRHGGRNVS